MPPLEKPPVGNPLFLKWLEELRDAAREKGSKAVDTYNKACQSLAACPVVYERPRDLAQLRGIGAKTVDILEQRYKKYCQDNGLNVPGNTPTKPAAKGKSKARTPVSGDESVPPAKKRKSRQAYIPQNRSGGYGILLALAISITPNNAFSSDPDDYFTRREFLTKGEIVRAAQPFCDMSYTHSDKGTYFTAWNSMKTLINKGYVYVSGSPQKYSLTEEGYNVAATLRNLNPECSHLPKLPLMSGTGNDDLSPVDANLTPDSSFPCRPSPPQSLDFPIKSVSTPEISAQPRAVCHPNKFYFWYIDSGGKRTLNLEDAATRLDPEEFVTIRKIEFRESQQSHPFVSHLRLVDSRSQVRDATTQATLFAYVIGDEAPPKCSRFQEDDETYSRKNQESITSLREGEPSHRNMGSLLQSDPYTTLLSPAPTISSIGRTPSVSSLPSYVKGLPAPRLSGPTDPLSTTINSSSIAISTTTPFNPSRDPIIFPAGSYEIILVIDSREVESRSNRDKIAETLLSKGVKVEKRALRLGDMCWVARRISGQLGGEEDECVLDYVVERKRLDDLCFSIRDGRYHEQCHRLSNSGIGHVYYIVEDWQVAEKMEFHGLQINTVKSQLQVHNGFFLKETHKLSETIDFLVAVTDVIQASSTTTDLYVIPTRCLSRSTYTNLQRQLRSSYHSDSNSSSNTASKGRRVYLTTFEAYQDLNDKTGTRTLKERFARMLLSVRGMSAERVASIIEMYPTPAALWIAIKRRLAESEGGREDQEQEGQRRIDRTISGTKKIKVRGPELWFADHFPGEGRRKIGDALSRELWRALMGDEAVSMCSLEA